MEYLPAGLILLFLGFVGGYLCGRKSGRKEGVSEGELYAPLELRRRGLENGWCPICCSRLGPYHTPLGRRNWAVSKSEGHHHTNGNGAHRPLP